MAKTPEFTPTTAHRSRWDTVVRFACGALLVVAGGLKLYGVNASILPAVGPLSAIWVQASVAIWELFLGGWLVTGFAHPIARLAALATFLVFALVSGYLGLIGVARCGCFGAVSVSPWVAFGVDVTVLTVLAVARPTENLTARSFVRPVAAVGVGAAALLALLAGAGGLVFGSLDAAQVWLRGDGLSAPEYVDFGAVPPGEVAARTITVTNHSLSPVRLYAGTGDCSCNVINDLPAVVPAGGSVELTVKLLPPKEPGAFTRQAALLTDCPSHRTIWLSLGCQVMP
jgi:hypothetical protein